MNKIFLLALFSSLLLAQKGNLAGSVHDAQSSQALVGVNISIAGTEIGAASDKDGQFVIVDIPAGSYNIEIEYIGYKKIMKNNVVISSGRTRVLDIHLHEDILKTKGIEVTTSYFEIPKESVVSSKSMNFEEIRRAPGSNMDIQRVVQELPSVVSGSDQMNEIITRGGNPGENLFLMDKIEIPNPNHFGLIGSGGGPINVINTLMVKNVDFYAGAFSAKYGDKASSVMNISLVEGRRSGFSGNMDLSVAGIGGIVEGPVLNGSGSYLLSARKSYLDLIIKNTGLVAIPYYYNLQGKMVFDLSPANKITINALYGNDHINIENKDGAGYNRGAENARSANQQFAAGVTLRSLWEDQLVTFLTLSAVGNSWDAEAYRTASKKSYALNKATEKEYNLRLEANWMPTKSVNVEFGAGVKIPDFDHEFWYDRDTTFIYDIAGANPDSIIGIYNIRPEYNKLQKGNGLKTSAYTQVKTMLSPTTELNAGLRFDSFDYNGFSCLSPRLGIKQSVTSSFNISLAAGRHFQTPKYIYLTANEDNKELKDYYSDQIILGFEKLFGPDIRSTIEVYYKNYSDIPVEYQKITGDPYGYYNGLVVNRGESYSYGLEFFFQKKLTLHWSGIVSYSYSKAQTRDLRDNSWMPGDFDYRHVFNVVGGYKYSMQHLSWYKDLKKQLWYQISAFFIPFADEVEWSLRYRFMGGRPYTQPVYYPERREWVTDIGQSYNTYRYPAYHRLDIHLDRRFFFSSWTLVTYLDIANIFNRDNLWQHQYNDDGSIDEVLQYKTFPVVGVTLEF